MHNGRSFGLRGEIYGVALAEVARKLDCLTDVSRQHADRRSLKSTISSYSFLTLNSC